MAQGMPPEIAPSKLLRLHKRHLSCESASGQQLRKLKRQNTSGNSDQESCIFGSEVSGTLHNCVSMKLDHDLRRMATELQDSSLLSRISGNDLMAIEAKYHFNCLSTFKNKYRAVQRTQNNLTISQEDQLIQALVFADLISHIEERIESGTFIFKLSELHGMYMSLLKELGIERSVHRTSLKLQILDHFLGECQEQLSDGKSIVLVFNQGVKNMLKEAVDSCDYESDAYINWQLWFIFVSYQAALIQHTNWALYQASIWSTCLRTQQNIPTPEGFDCTQHDQSWKPVWTLLPEVARACQELLKCGCKSFPFCSRKCKCRDAGLSCTALATVVAHVTVNALMFSYFIGSFYC